MSDEYTVEDEIAASALRDIDATERTRDMDEHPPESHTRVACLTAYNETLKRDQSFLMWSDRAPRAPIYVEVASLAALVWSSASHIGMAGRYRDLVKAAARRALQDGNPDVITLPLSRPSHVFVRLDAAPTCLAAWCTGHDSAQRRLGEYDFSFLRDKCVSWKRHCLRQRIEKYRTKLARVRENMRMFLHEHDAIRTYTFGSTPAGAPPPTKRARTVGAFRSDPVCACGGRGGAAGVGTGGGTSDRSECENNNKRV